MSCCDDAKNERLYRAATPTGQAVYCVKCGRAHPATSQEVTRILAGGQADD